MVFYSCKIRGMKLSKLHQILIGTVFIPLASLSCSHKVSQAVVTLDPEKQILAFIGKNPNDPAPRISIAKRYAATGRTHSAIQQAEIARKLGAVTDENLFFLQKLYKSQGEAEQAAAVLAAGASQPNCSPSLRLSLSQAYLDIGDFSSAANALLPLLKKPASLSLSEQMSAARTLLMAGRISAAEKLIPKPENDPETFALIGFSEALKGRNAAAVQALLKACHLNPQDAWNTTLLARAELAAGDKKSALKSFQTAISLPDAPPHAFISAAELMIEAGHAREAAQILRGIPPDLQKDPAYWNAQVSLSRALKQPVSAAISEGYAAFHNGDPWLAEKIWLRTIPLATGEDTSELYAAIFNSAYLRQDAVLSMRIMNEAVKKWPQNPYFAHKHSELLLGQNMLKESLAEAERYRSLASPQERGTASELFCRIALDSGKYDLLVQNAKIVRDLSPSDPLPVLHLAEWQLNQGRSKENLEATLKLTLEAISIAPDSAEARSRAGIVLNDLNRPEEAEDQLLKALTIDPRILDGTANFTLAQIYQKQGRTAESQFEQVQYTRMQRLKDGWLAMMKAFRKDTSAAEWKQLGERALLRHDNWIALCAFHQAATLAKGDHSAWLGLAAVQKRMGRFEDSIASMQHAN